MRTTAPALKSPVPSNLQCHSQRPIQAPSPIPISDWDCSPPAAGDTPPPSVPFSLFHHSIPWITFLVLPTRQDPPRAPSKNPRSAFWFLQHLLALSRKGTHSQHPTRPTRAWEQGAPLTWARQVPPSPHRAGEPENGVHLERERGEGLTVPSGPQEVTSRSSSIIASLGVTSRFSSSIPFLGGHLKV